MQTRKFVSSMPWGQHVLIALILGFVARALTSYFVYGSQSNDDYSHAILPAINAANGIVPKIPDWRSPLIVWTLTPIAQLGHLLGIEAKFALIRFILFSLGLFSLTGVWFYARYARVHRSLLALYLLAGHFVMTFGATRAFGESIAATLMLIAFIAMDEAEEDGAPLRTGLFFFGCLCLGISCLYRFQIGVMGVGFAVAYAAGKKWRQFGWIALAGLIAAALQAFIDARDGRVPLSTLYNYLYVNKDGAVEHSVQPFYNTWLTLLPMWLLPFSFALMKYLPRLPRAERRWLVLIAVFTALHSMIPHKEERFLFPIVPLMLIMLGKLWEEAWGDRFEKWFFRPFATALLSVGLVVTCFSNSQAGEYEPLRYAEAMGEDIMILDNDSTVRECNFVWQFADGKRVRFNELGHWPSAAELEQLGMKRYLLVTSNAEQFASWPAVQATLTGWSCGEPIQVQSPGDYLLFKMNPKYNHRRRPEWMIDCRK